MSPRISLVSILLLGIALPLAAWQGEEAVTVFKRVSPSVVGLESVGGSGTGMLLNTEGLILTNAHVIAVPLPFKCHVESMKGTKSENVVFQKVKIVGVHPRLDLALVKIDPNEIPGVTLRPVTVNKNAPSTGQTVYAIGNPGNAAGVKLAKTITSGLLSGVDRQVEGDTYLQISTPINPGNSGGPLVDRTGKVIGVVTLKLTDVDNVGFALPVTNIRSDEFIPLRERVASPERASKLIEASSKIIAEINKLQAAGKGKSREAELGRLIAIKVLHEALLMDSTNGSIYSTIAGLLDDFGESAQAEAYFLAGLEASLWGKDSRIYRSFGLHLLKRNKGDDAIAVWNEGIAKHPHTSGLIWEDLSLLYKHRSDWVQAARCATAAATFPDGTRPNVAWEVGSLGRSKATLEQHTAITAEVKQMGDEMLRRTLYRDVLLNHPKGVLTKPFADLLTRGGATPPPAKSAGATPVSPSSPRLFDLKLASSSGIGSAWAKKGSEPLKSPETGVSRWDAAPETVPEEYDLILAVERAKGKNGLTVGFTARGEFAALVLDYNGAVTGFSGIKTPLHRAPILAEGQPALVVIQVRESGFKLRVNEKEILSVAEKGPLPKPADQWINASATPWFLGSQDSSFIVHGWWMLKALSPSEPAETGNPLLAGKTLVDVINGTPPAGLVTTSSLPATNTTAGSGTTPSRVPGVTPSPLPGTTVGSSANPFVPVTPLPSGSNSSTSPGIQEIARKTGVYGERGCAGISLDGKFVAYTGPKSSLCLFNTATNSTVFDTGVIKDYTDFTFLTFSPRGDKLLAGDRTKLGIWAVIDGQLFFERDYASHGRATITVLQFSPDGKNVLSGSNQGDLRYWELATGRDVYAWGGFKAGAKAVHFLPMGDAYASDGESLFKFNLRNGGAEKLGLALGNGLTPSVCFSLDGSQIAVADRTRLRRWTIADSRELPSAVIAKDIRVMQYAAGAKRLFVGGGSKVTVFDPMTGLPVDALDAGNGNGNIVSLSAVPDGKRFAVVLDNSLEPKLQIYDWK